MEHKINTRLCVIKFSFILKFYNLPSSFFSQSFYNYIFIIIIL